MKGQDMLRKQTRRSLGVIAMMVAVALALVGLPAAQQQATAQPAQTIAEIAAGDSDLSFLVSALTLASDSGPVDFIAAASDPAADLTVFAPTNAAFGAMDQATLSAVVNDPGGLLTQVLSYHVLGSAESGADLVAAGAATTLGGGDVTVEVRNGDVFINNSQVVIADVQASNGIVHVIDMVLVPGATPPPPPPPPPPPAEPTVLEIVAGNSDLSFLASALTLASDSGPADFIAAASDPTSDLTVFAPTNAAFGAIDQATLNAAINDPGGLLTQVLAYHLLGSTETAADLVAAGSATTLELSDVSVEVRNGDVFINNSQVVIADVQASNGIVHVIDMVLVPGATPPPPPPPGPTPTATPPPPPPAPPTIVDVALGTPELSTLVDALTLASAEGPVDFLAAASDPTADLTVFAPTNAAFAALDPATLDAVLGDPGGLLTDILAYHVLGSSESGADLVAAGAATTLLGSDVAVEARNGKVFINDSEVVIADIVTANGIVHVIDAVLLPAPPPPPPPPPPPAAPTIVDVALGTPELSTLVDALTLASAEGPVDFLAAASDPTADLTVFAPTNAAFAALDPATLDAVLGDPGGLLTDILAYHVLGSSESGADLVAAGAATTLLGSDVAVEARNGKVFINDSEVVIADIVTANGIVHVIDAVLIPAAPDPGPDAGPIFDGAHVHIISAVSHRWLDGDVHYWGTVVDTSSHPSLDDEWQLEQTKSGNWRLINAAHHLYLDADSPRKHNDVNLNARQSRGTEWEITQLDNGNYLLRAVDYDRYLDYDRHNVDTSKYPRADDEWQIVLINK